ncbi:reverse transcriptase-like protein, partial [Schaalia georgiae]
MALNIKRLIIRENSQLVINQINKNYNYPQITPYVKKIRKLKRKFKNLRFEHVKRKNNFATNELSKITVKQNETRALLKKIHR